MFVEKGYNKDLISDNAGKYNTTIIIIIIAIRTTTRTRVKEFIDL